MTGDYSITCINMSSVSWSRHHWRAPDDAAFSIDSKPHETLDAAKGVQVLAWSQKGNGWGSGGTDGYADGQVIWTAPNGKCFGI
jgi:hypothetical protein